MYLLAEKWLLEALLRACALNPDRKSASGLVQQALDWQKVRPRCTSCFLRIFSAVHCLRSAALSGHGSISAQTRA